MKNYRYLLLGMLLFASTLAMAQIPSYLKGNEAQAYKNHTAEINSYAKITIGDEMGKLAIKHSLSSAELVAVKPSIEEIETRKATYNFIYMNDDTTRFKAKQQVAREYEPALVKQLFKAGKIVGSYNCRMIMRNKDTLKLNPSQQESILAWAVEVNKMLEGDPKMELRSHEFPLFSKIFTPKQLDLFLALKMNDEVKGQVQKSWKTLKENGLEYGLDSATVSAELFRYHMARDRAIYINYSDATLREVAVKNINDAAPVAIKRINSIPEAQKAKNAYNGTLTW